MAEAARRERRLRRSCRSLLRDLDIRPPLDVGQLCERLGEHRGRPIELYPYPIVTPGPFGLWFCLSDSDAIFFQQETTPAHQAHIVMHELGHLLADHPSDETDSDAAVRVIREQLPGFEDPPRGRRRTCYDSDYEREAELVATIVLNWAAVADQVATPSTTTTARRLDAALGDRVGWL